jgi:hypothetical protein
MELHTSQGFLSRHEVAGDYLYWVEPSCKSGTTILRRRIDGSDAPLMIAKLVWSGPAEMRVHGEHVYFIDAGPTTPNQNFGKLYRVAR